MGPFWVDTEKKFRLAIVPRSRGGDWLEDDIAHLKQDGVDLLVSMLLADEAADLGLSAERYMRILRDRLPMLSNTRP